MCYYNIKSITDIIKLFINNANFINTEQPKYITHQKEKINQIKR